MCRTTKEVNLLCDKCSARDKNGEIDEVMQLCPRCQEAAEKRFCWHCMTAYETAEEAGIVNEMCKACREEQRHVPS